MNPVQFNANSNSSSQKIEENSGQKKFRLFGRDIIINKSNKELNNNNNELNSNSEKTEKLFDIHVNKISYNDTENDSGTDIEDEEVYHSESDNDYDLPKVNKKASFKMTILDNKIIQTDQSEINTESDNEFDLPRVNKKASYKRMIVDDEDLSNKSLTPRKRLRQKTINEDSSSLDQPQTNPSYSEYEENYTVDYRSKLRSRKNHNNNSDEISANSNSSSTYISKLRPRKKNSHPVFIPSPAKEFISNKNLNKTNPVNSQGSANSAEIRENDFKTSEEYRKNKEFKKALDVLSPYMSEHILAWYYAAKCHRDMGDKDRFLVLMHDIINFSFPNSEKPQTVKNIQGATANKLGIWYEKGKHGLRKNQAEAEKFYQKAIEYGCTEAIFNLGFLKDMSEDYESAIKYYQQALDKGLDYTHYNLALVYRELEEKDNTSRDKTIAHFHQCINKLEKKDDLSIEEARILGDSYHLLADHYQNDGNLAKAQLYRKKSEGYKEI